MRQTSKRYVFVLILTWSLGSDGAHQFSCDRKLRANSDTTSDIFCRFSLFRVFDSSLTSLFFSKQWHRTARSLVAVLADDRREKVFLSCPLEVTKTTNAEKRGCL